MTRLELKQDGLKINVPFTGDRRRIRDEWEACILRQLTVISGICCVCGRSERV